MLSVVCVTYLLHSCSAEDYDFDIDEDGVEAVSPIKSNKAEINNFFESEIEKFFTVDTIITDSINDKSYVVRVSCQEDKNYIVNNADELISIYNGVKTVPDIDFDKFTLILGTVYVPGSQYLIKTRLVPYETFYQLNIYVKPVYKDGECYLCAFMNRYYWLLYPKIVGTDIKVKRINLQ